MQQLMPAFSARTARTNATGIELAFRFVLWMQAQPCIPTPRAIADAWGVHKATAWRWRRDYLAASGQFDPRAIDPSPAATGTHPHHSRPPQ